MGTSEPAQPDDAGAEWILLGGGRRVRTAAVEITFSASSGPGGQNVNKRATRAQLRVAVADLPLTPAARDRFRRLAGARLTGEDELLLSCGVHRHARRNRAECVHRLAELVAEAARTPKVRRPTKPSAGARARRLEGKRRRGAKKRDRGWSGDD
ncbi:MAG: alternative ribosome rescue aminoacyl-tRNA hydrolase ArfB [Planctomycetota bacterium]